MAAGTPWIDVGFWLGSSLPLPLLRWPRVGRLVGAYFDGLTAIAAKRGSPFVGKGGITWLGYQNVM